MYNEELKERFIEKYTKSEANKASCRSIFNRLQKYEEEWGSDFCTKSVEEIEPVLNKVLGVRKYTSSPRIIILKNYSKWCMENEVDGACDAVFHINYDNSEKIKYEMISSPLHLQKFLNALCCSEEMNTVDDTIRCYYWLAFAGVPEKYVETITVNDVNFEDMIISVEGVHYRIYPEALKAFKNCVNSTSFVFIHPNYLKDIYRDRIPGNKLLRGIKGEVNVLRIRESVSRRGKKALSEGKTKTKTSYGKVWMSGIFYREHLAEMAGENPEESFRKIAIDHANEVGYKLDKTKSTVNSKVGALVKGLVEDYNNWKRAFS